MGHKVKAMRADSFKGETGKAEWLSTPGNYPSADGSDQTFRLSLEKALSNFYLKANMSHTVMNWYYSKEYCAQVFAASGLVSYEEAQSLLGIAWLGMLQPWRPFGTITENIGVQLHTIYKGREALILAAIACQGSFQGERGWTLFNQTLVQGAWPWLGNYPKSYAKTHFLAMVCLFTIVRQNRSQGANIGALILALARKLVDTNCWGVGEVKIRYSDSLSDPKALYEPVPKKPLVGSLLSFNHPFLMWTTGSSCPSRRLRKLSHTCRAPFTTSPNLDLFAKSPSGTDHRSNTMSLSHHRQEMQSWPRTTLHRTHQARQISS